MWGEGTKMAAGLRAARLSPALRGRRGLVLTFQCGPPARRGHLSRPRNPTRGAPETPYGWRGSAKERGYAHHSAWEASPALRWLPAAVYPETVGPAGAGPRRGQRSGRAQGGRLLGVARSRPPHAAARRTGAARDCPVPPRGREPGAAASASPGPAPRPGSAGAGVSVSREDAARGLGLTKAGVGVLEEGASPAPNCGPNEMQAWFATLTTRTLGKCKRHWQIQGKQAEFLLATK